MLYDSSRGITSQRSSKSNYVARTILKTLRNTGDALGRNFEEGAPGRTTQKLMDLVLEEYDSTEMIEQIRQVLMTELGLSSEEISSRYLLNTLNSYLREIRWTPTETIMTGIGQSITEVTPVGVARYIAAGCQRRRRAGGSAGGQGALARRQRCNGKAAQHHLPSGRRGCVAERHPAGA